MNKKKLGKLRRELEQLRAAKYSLKTKDLTRFAGKIGRKPKTSRGKEPTYVSDVFPQLNPLSIPGHTTVNPFTASNIMDTFEADLDKWEDLINEQEAKQKKELQETKENAHGECKQLPAETVREDSDSSRTEGIPRTDP